jgi:hypothetical protein
MLTTIINGSIDIFGVYFTKLGKKKWKCMKPFGLTMGAKISRTGTTCE